MQDPAPRQDPVTGRKPSTRDEPGKKEPAKKETAKKRKEPVKKMEPAKKKGPGKKEPARKGEPGKEKETAKKREPVKKERAKEKERAKKKESAKEKESATRQDPAGGWEPATSPGPSPGRSPASGRSPAMIEGQATRRKPSTRQEPVKRQVSATTADAAPGQAPSAIEDAWTRREAAKQDPTAGRDAALGQVQASQDPAASDESSTFDGSRSDEVDSDRSGSDDALPASRGCTAVGDPGLLRAVPTHSLAETWEPEALRYYIRGQLYWRGVKDQFLALGDWDCVETEGLEGVSTALFDVSQMEPTRMEAMAKRIDEVFAQIIEAEEQAIADARQGMFAEPSTREFFGQTRAGSLPASGARSEPVKSPSIDAIVRMVERAVMQVGMHHSVDLNDDRQPSNAISLRLVKIVAESTGAPVPTTIFSSVQVLARAVDGHPERTGIERDFERALRKGMLGLMGAG
jgi:hypothetical protein